MTLFAAAFWRDALERIVRTFAQTTAGLLPTSWLPGVSIPWWAAFAGGGFAALGCLLTCLAGAQVGDARTASLLKPDEGHSDVDTLLLVLTVTGLLLLLLGVTFR